MPPFSKAMLKQMGLDAVASTLHKMPEKEKGKAVPHTNVYHRDAVHQADLIFLPHDRVGKTTYKYALIVVDLHTGYMDGEAIEEKTAETTTRAIETIYKREVLDFPNRLETDPGSEFKSSFAQLMVARNVELRYGKKGRHRQQSVVENRNYAVGYALNLRMASIEEITGKTSRDWVSFLPTVVAAFNQQIADKLEKRRGKKPKDHADAGPRCEKKKGCELLEEGDKVRVLLEEPVDNVTSKQLHGKFRSGDRRWDDRVRTVHQVVVRPDQPALYIVTEPEPGSTTPAKVAHTRQQLQVVRSNEPEIDAKKLNIRPSNADYQVHSLQGKKNIAKKVHFLVRWKGYPAQKDYSWEPRANLMQSGADVQEMVKNWGKTSTALAPAQPKPKPKPAVMVKQKGSSSTYGAGIFDDVIKPEPKQTVKAKKKHPSLPIR